MHRDINSLPVGSRKSYKCVKQNFCLKTEQTDGQIYSFSELFQAKKSPVCFEVEEMFVNNQIYEFDHLNLI